MVFADSSDRPFLPFIIGLVTGFDGQEVIFTDASGGTHFLGTYYSWLHVVCPD